MDPGEFLTRWTVRLAMALYVLALSIRWNARGRRRWLIAARLAWTGGCMLFVVHVACAFAFFHGWSHFLSFARKCANITWH